MLKACLLDPSKQQHVDTLLSQRRACGWGEEMVPQLMQYVTEGSMVYFLFYEVDSDASSEAVGSGAVDVGTGIYGRELSCLATKMFSVMGIFIWSRFRGKGYSRCIANFLLDYGFKDVQPPQEIATVMTNAASPITNPLFESLGFREFWRGPKPEWHEADSTGIYRRLHRDAWAQIYREKQGGHPVTITLPKPEFVYFLVALDAGQATQQANSHDLLFWRHLITEALTADHGLLGASIHVDILHHEPSSALKDERVILRVPRDARRMAWESMSGWVDAARGLTLRLINESEHLTSLL